MSHLPLYKKAEPELEGHGNQGLWYNKFCNAWNVNFANGKPRKREEQSTSTEKLAKSEWIEQMTHPKGVGDGNALKRTHKRMAKLLAHSPHRMPTFTTASRFIPGIGNANPVENGLTWHHTLGVPYLPGTSVKGLVREWAEQWVHVEKSEIEKVFGGEKKVGSIIFFDALPTKPVQLESNIMTPHYAEYYGNGEEPKDWQDPIPIPFLTVASGQEFNFPLMVRPGAEADEAQLELVEEWLGDALMQLGAGAKTAVGYGVFREKK